MTVSLISPARGQTFSYDANGNLVSKDHGTQTFTYTYDALDRLLTEIRDFSPLQDYSYDPNGNRTALTIDGVTDPYNYATYSNQLEATFAGQYTYDAAGNILSDPEGRTFEYDEAGRLAKAYVDGSLVATYTYNAQNQRMRKETPTETILYHYDLAGNLISETDQTGAVLKAYLWQDGQPVAQITAAGTETVAYLHTDHLQTPRQASDQNGKVIWRWDDVDAFGVTSADEDPDGDGNPVNFNLRFPGQYFDEETGLHYNHHRYYSPQTGRYVTSDPIGLDGGLNTYGYGLQNPTRFIDPTGEIFPLVLGPIVVGGGFQGFGTVGVLTGIGVLSAITLSGDTARTDDNQCDEFHRGRIQAQGAGYQDSEAWSQRTPLTIAEGLAKLDALVARMPRRVRQARSIAIEKARQWMIVRSQNGGVSAFIAKTFQNPGSRRGERIDIEVHEGRAFVP